MIDCEHIKLHQKHKKLTMAPKQGSSDCNEKMRSTKAPQEGEPPLAYQCNITLTCIFQGQKTNIADDWVMDTSLEEDKHGNYDMASEILKKESFWEETFRLAKEYLISSFRSSWGVEKDPVQKRY